MLSGRQGAGAPLGELPARRQLVGTTPHPICCPPFAENLLSEGLGV